MNTQHWQPGSGLEFPAIEHLAAVGTLLVASDFDGTLSPIVDNPSDAAAHPSAADALAAIAAAPNTELAILSGRSFEFLSQIGAVPAGSHLVGSHGAEYLKPGISGEVELASRLARVAEMMLAIGERFEGTEVEVKPASVALHYRHVEPDLVDDVIVAIESGPGAVDGVEVQHGKKVVELGLTAANKGAAITQLRADLGADAVIYFGDDTTDEDAFVVMSAPDLGVRVGGGPTAAALRVDEPSDVTELLHEIARLRSAKKST